VPNVIDEFCMVRPTAYKLSGRHSPLSLPDGLGGAQPGDAVSGVACLA
jgi:hypothetical protein